MQVQRVPDCNFGNIYRKRLHRGVKEELSQLESSADKMVQSEELYKLYILRTSFTDSSFNCYLQVCEKNAQYSLRNTYIGAYSSSLCCLVINISKWIGIQVGETILDD